MTEIATAAGVGRVTLYAHFPSRGALLEAAVHHALGQAIAALDAAELDDGPPTEALGRMVRSNWSILARYRGLLTAAGELPPSRFREHHVGVLDRLERLIARGQADGAFRADIPRDWLVTVCFSLFHAAAQEVGEDRLDPAIATAVLEATLRGVLAPTGVLGA